MRIVEVLKYALAPDEIDARVLERQRAGESTDERNVRYAIVLGSTRSEGPQTRIGLDIGNPTHWAIGRG